MIFTGRKIIVAIILLVTVTLTALNPAAAASRKIHIAVLFSYSGKVFDETLAGFKGYLEGSGVEAAYSEYRLDGCSEELKKAVSSIAADRPDLIFTLGSMALRTALEEFRDIPVVAGLILRAGPLLESENATGVILEYPVRTQLLWLKRIIPGARTIGVIYNKAENEERIAKAVTEAARLGLTLIAEEVTAPKDLPMALEYLSRRVDIIWGLADRIVFTPETAKHLLIYSFRNRIPLVGLSSAWVKAGAIYSLDWDYDRIGIQCGEMAVGILSGEKAASLRPATPDRVVYSLNLRTARHMKIEIPEEIIKKADKIFDDE